jgi:hypothetical protein
MPRIGEAIKKLLSLPTSTVESDFGNNHLYISSFVATQPEIFNAVVRATRTSEADWQVERKVTQELIDEGRLMVEQGNMAGHFKIIYGVCYQPGNHGPVILHGVALIFLDNRDEWRLLTPTA